MPVTEEELKKARAMVEALNAECKRQGVAGVFSLTEKQINGQVEYFLELALPEFGILKTMPIKPKKEVMQ